MATSYDLIVAGAGVLGLWVARMARRRGLSTLIIDARRPAAGASATPLAALLPHLPDRFDAKKQFQLAALVDLQTEIAALEAETGQATGYARRGRVVPIRTASFHDKAAAAVSGASTHWAATPYVCQIAGTEDLATLDGWIAPGAEPLGVLHDTLSASVDGSAFTAALAAATAAVCDVRHETPLGAWDTATMTALAPDGSRIASAAACVIAAGYESFPVLDRLLDALTGDGVKGHAATFRLPEALDGIERRPVLYDGGIYVVPTDARTLVVGSTTEFKWADTQPDQVTAADMIARARSLCAPLANARQVGLWAGIRPRAASRNPLVGHVPGQPGLFVATGGYKITFGIGHRLAACLIDEVMSGHASPDLPGAFHAGRALRHAPSHPP